MREQLRRPRRERRAACGELPIDVNRRIGTSARTRRRSPRRRGPCRTRERRRAPVRRHDGHVADAADVLQRAPRRCRRTATRRRCGTSGAPCPPAATSRTRKSLTTSMPVRFGDHRRFADLPRRVRRGSCQTVWPCEPIARTSLRADASLARCTSTAASASHPPRSKASAVVGGRCRAASARASRSRCSSVYGRADEGEQVGANARLACGECHGRRGHAVERRAGHEADVDAHARRTGGGGADARRAG